MRRHLAFAVALSAVALVGAATAQASWIFLPSSYTHDPATGSRVAQYAPKQASYVRSDPTYQQSVYRHHRSSIRAGGSADRLHLVETWGAGETIRPYGEWQRPFREGATPYGPWGNPAGPWTTPFGAWINPYGLGRLPPLPWYPWFQGPYRPLTPQADGFPYVVPGEANGAASADEEG